MDFKKIFNVLIVPASVILIDFLFRASCCYGSSDAEGLGWFNLLSLTGMVIIFFFYSVALALRRNLKAIIKILYILAYLAIFSLYFFFFGDFGVRSLNNPEYQIELAKAKDLYVGNITFSDSLIIRKKDTFRLGNGWTEYETQFDHMNLVPRNVKTGNLIYLVQIKGIKSPLGIYDNLQWQINDSSAIGSEPIDSVISFRSVPSKKENILYFLQWKMGQLITILVSRK